MSRSTWSGISRQDRLPEPNREIVACGFFEAGALPAETTDGTRLRIAEVLQGKAPTATWRQDRERSALLKSVS